MIVSAAGSMTTDMSVVDPNTAVSELITWEMFLDYVTLLYTNPALARPVDTVAPTEWDDFEVGAGTIVDFTSGTNIITFDAAYPNEAFSTQFNGNNPALGTSPYTWIGRSVFATPGNKLLCSDYAAVYVSAAEAADVTAGTNDTEGWYVFGPGVDTAPGSNGYIAWTTPVAWPTGANNDDGYLGNNNAVVHEMGVAWLSNYTGAAGSGGTDSWSAFPGMTP